MQDGSIAKLPGYEDTYPVYVDNLWGISCMLTTCGAFFHVGTISEMCTPVTLPLCSVPHYGINASLVNALIKAAGRKEGRGRNVKKGNFPEKRFSESLRLRVSRQNCRSPSTWAMSQNTVVLLDNICWQNLNKLVPALQRSAPLTACILFDFSLN